MRIERDIVDNETGKGSLLKGILDEAGRGCSGYVASLQRREADDSGFAPMRLNGS